MNIRTTQPKNNKYYIRKPQGGLSDAVLGKPTISGANVLCNCVGYANSRFAEIQTDPDLKGIYAPIKYQLVCNAENFIEKAKAYGLKINDTPIEGGIMVWQKGNTLSDKDGAGHVAVVERVYDDGTILTSESGWNAWAFKTVRRDNSNGRWGQSSAYKFRGCIINPAVKNPKVVPAPKLTVDGIGGACTIRALQKYLGTPQDGELSSQNKSLMKKYAPSVTAVTYGKNGSVCVKALQKWLGISADGIWGQGTSKALQNKLGVSADGIFGTNSMKALQKFLNGDLTPTPTKKFTSDTFIDVSDWQDVIDWSKVKASGIGGAIIRYADGDTLDKKFERNMQEIKKYGLHFGVYIFSRAKTAAQAEKEAQRLYDAAHKYGPDMPYYIDLEVKGLRDYAPIVAVAFLNKMAKLGVKGGVYASLDWWNTTLKKVASDYSASAFWLAQWNDKITHKNPSLFGLWQYSSSGSVPGISGRCDMNKCYVKYWEKVTPTPTPAPEPVPEKKGYTGTYPTTALVKTVYQVIADAITFAKWIVNDSRFGYGRKGGSKYEGTKEYSITHSGGCHFCGTNASKISKAKKAGLKNPEEWEYTFVCNTLVHAAFAHAGVPSMLKAGGHSWWSSSYDKSVYWTKIPKPAKFTDLKPGDVLFTETHAMLYIGNGKIAEATSGGGDPSSSKTAWINSIHIKDYTASRYKSVYGVYRLTKAVNTTANIRYGEVSDRVGLLQSYLAWYGIKLTADRIFGDATLAAVKQFQNDQKLDVDGIVGPKTIEAMKKVVK